MRLLFRDIQSGKRWKAQGSCLFFIRQAQEEKEDKDQRKLPNSQRISLAKKNKDEGNELFRAGTLDQAILRQATFFGFGYPIEPVRV
jgi:hypothetical protein